MSRPARVAALLVSALLLPCAAGGAEPLVDRETADRIKRGTGLLQSVSQTFRQEQPLTPLELQRRAYGVVEHPPLDQALARILDNVRRAAGVDAPPARIHVTPDPGLNAFAAEDGSIFIAAGMLRSLGSEDEVAALVAHEYAHVLRGHSGRTMLQRAKDIGAGLSALYMDYEHGEEAGSRSRPEATFVRHALLREAAMHSVQSGIVPSRARAQEDEADRLGVDLLVAAGYNPVGMVEMLGRLDAWEVQRQAAAAAATAAGEAAEVDGVGGTLVRYAEGSDQARAARSKLDGDSSSMVNSLFSSLVSGAQKRVRAAGRSHRASSERIDLVLGHLEARHADNARPDMRPVPWAAGGQAAALFESIDLVQALLGDNGTQLSRPGPEQVAALQRVSKSPAGQTPLGRYVMLRHLSSAVDSREGMAAWHQELERGDSLFAAHRLVLDSSRRLPSEPAVRMFEASRQSLADPPELLPYGISIYRRAGQPETAEQYAARCRGSGNERLRQACAEAR